MAKTETNGIRRRLVTEWCPSCQAAPGEHCRALIKLRLTGEVRPIADRTKFHDMIFSTEGK